MSIRVETDERVEIRDVTADVSRAISDGVSEGVCTVFVPHTTAGVVVNESEGRLIADVERVLEQARRGGIEETVEVGDEF